MMNDDDDKKTRHINPSLPSPQLTKTAKPNPYMHTLLTYHAMF